MDAKKKCNACLEEKEISNFHGDKYRPDGYCDKCKECFKEKRKAVKVVELIGESQVCASCNIEKDLRFFKPRSDRAYKYERRCKECVDKGHYIENIVFLNSTKKCSICKVYKEFSDYQSCGSCTNGITHHCKSCDKIKSKMYRDSIPQETKRQRKKEEYEKNKVKYIKRAREWTDSNRERHNALVRIRIKDRRKNEPLFKLKSNIRSLVKTTFLNSLKGDYTKNSKTLEILNCSMEYFMSHIESQFLNWMNWENYGNCEANDYTCSWHLDHIIPISIIKSEEDLYSLNHWSNFQPLCSKVNIKDKGTKIYPCSNLELKITILNNKIIKYE